MNRSEIIFSITSALDKVGVSLSDTLLVHADSSGLVKASNSSDWSLALEMLTEAFRNKIGPTGNILVPTFNWDFCIGKPYCDVTTTSRQGVFANFVRKLESSQRSPHPIFSFSGFGPDVNKIFDGISKSSFGRDSVFDRLHRANAKLIFFNTSFYNCTFVHHIEHMLNVSYRYSKKFKGEVTINQKTYIDEYEFYVRDEKLNVVSYPTRLGDKLLDLKLMHSEECIGGRILAVNTQDVFRIAQSCLAEDEYFLLKSNPNNGR